MGMYDSLQTSEDLAPVKADLRSWEVLFYSIFKFSPRMRLNKLP